MKSTYSCRRALGGFLALWLLSLAACSGKPDEENAPVAAGGPVVAVKPALSVSTTTPQLLEWPQVLSAGGNVAAWQEAVIGAEISPYRITEVRAQVGDRVKKGQVLVRIAADAIENEFAEARASVAEAAATLAEARANQQRASQLTERGFYSTQQNTQTQTAAETALARLHATQARLQSAELKLAKTNVLAPDDGIISAHSATVGSLTQPGQELFRLIRGGRLEWRAEVTAAELGQLKPGLTATLISPNGKTLTGVVRAIAPTVDPHTLTGLVYVDLPDSVAVNVAVSAGMFARGEFQLGQRSALTLPQSAVLLREGFAYVFQVETGGHGGKINQRKIMIGRRLGERIEVSGLDAQAEVVASGVGFLADGDSVSIVPALTLSPKQP